MSGAIFSAVLCFIYFEASSLNFNTRLNFNLGYVALVVSIASFLLALVSAFISVCILDATTSFTAKKTAIHLSPRNAGCHTTSKIQTHSSGGSSFQRGTRFASRFGGSAGANSYYCSYRIEAATTSASVGLSPWLLKTLGRWSSDCYERCIHCPHALLFGFSRQLLDYTFN